MYLKPILYWTSHGKYTKILEIRNPNFICLTRKKKIIADNKTWYLKLGIEGIQINTKNKLLQQYPNLILYGNDGSSVFHFVI